MIHTLGLAALRVSNTGHGIELVSIAVEGLLGLLSYKLSFLVVSAVVRQLVQLVSTPSCIPSSIGEESHSEPMNLSLPTLTSIVLDSVITCFESEFTSLATVLASVTEHNKNSSVDRHVFHSAEFLAGVSEGLLYLSESLMHAKKGNILKALKNRVADLFIRLAFLAYSSNMYSVDSSGSMISIELVEALALLLHPLSIMFEMDSILTVKLHTDKNGRPHKGLNDDEMMSSLELQLSRHLWFTLLMFRIKEQSRWGHYSNW